MLRSIIRTSVRVSRVRTFNYNFIRNASVKVPEMAESITEGTLTTFNKKIGDSVAIDELLATIETDKIDIEVNSPVAGTVKELLVSEDDTVEVGQIIAEIDESGAGSSSSSGEKEDKSTESKSDSQPAEDGNSKETTRGGASGSADAPGTAGGSSGHSDAPRKDSEPLKKEIKTVGNDSGKTASKSAPPKSSTPSGSKSEKSTSGSKSTEKSGSADTFTSFSRNEERVKMNRMRLRIAERLKESQNTAASLTTFNEVDMSNLMDLRKQYKDEFLEKTGIKLGFMGAFAKASTLAAKEIPAINAAIENNDTTVFRDYVDISIAVATPKGLVTPVVRNAESRSILGIEQEIAALGKKARDGKLTLEDMAGGTFTISNGGVFGSLYGTPIINMPQTAVLGLHGVKERPVTVKGQIVSRPMMYLALTYDHRVVDGREAVVFLRTIKELIEDPRKMLLLQ